MLLHFSTINIMRESTCHRYCIELQHLIEKHNSEQNLISSYDNARNNNRKSSLEYKDGNRYYFLKRRIKAHEEEMSNIINSSTTANQEINNMSNIAYCDNCYRCNIPNLSDIYSFSIEVVRSDEISKDSRACNL